MSGSGHNLAERNDLPMLELRWVEEEEEDS
jgi:hypothetical protein